MRKFYAPPASPAIPVHAEVFRVQRLLPGSRSSYKGNGRLGVTQEGRKTPPERSSDIPYAVGVPNGWLPTDFGAG